MAWPKKRQTAVDQHELDSRCSEILLNRYYAGVVAEVLNGLRCMVLSGWHARMRGCPQLEQSKAYSMNAKMHEHTLV